MLTLSPCLNVIVFEALEVGYMCIYFRNNGRLEH